MRPLQLVTQSIRRPPDLQSTAGAFEDDERVFVGGEFEGAIGRSDRGGDCEVERGRPRLEVVVRGIGDDVLRARLRQHIP